MSTRIDLELVVGRDALPTILIVLHIIVLPLSSRRDKNERCHDYVHEEATGRLGHKTQPDVMKNNIIHSPRWIDAFVAHDNNKAVRALSRVLKRYIILTSRNKYSTREEQDGHSSAAATTRFSASSVDVVRMALF